MRGTAEAPTRRDAVGTENSPPQLPPHTQPDTGHPYYLHRTRRGQVGTHTVLPQYL